MAFAASSPVLSDRRRFPRFYHIAPQDRMKNAARISLFKEFNWTKLATIHHAIEFFSMVCFLHFDICVCPQGLS